MTTQTSITIPDGTKTLVIQAPGSSKWVWILSALLALSLFVCFLLFVGLIGSVAAGSAESGSIVETYESGSKTSTTKVAIIDIVGTIMPPLTSRVIEQAEHAAEDSNVAAVLLRIDSPGGLVADSHQIYHRLKKLSDAKPVYVSFGRLAASGGYYVAMGAGSTAKIFTEPTTWTGSIGVIIPHYEVNELAEKWGIEAKPLTTGPYKDALSPFREMTEDENELWAEIMADAFDRFRGVIVDNRSTMDDDAVRAAATGQIFTSSQALERGLVDQQGFEEEAVSALVADHQLGDVRVVRYGSPPSLLDVLSGSVSANTAAESNPLEQLRATMTPQPLYLFGWPISKL